MINLRTLVTAYCELEATRRPLMLATVVETLGSTYRKAGARMLITDDGQFHGIIGGGCFEGDLLEHARAVFDAGHPRLLFYDMRAQEDELWGLGLGCNGAVRLVLQRLDTVPGRNPLVDLEHCLRTRGRGVLATVCASRESDYPVGRHAFFADNAAAVDPGGDDRPEWLAQGARNVQQTGAPLFIEHKVGQSGITVFYDWVQPPPHLLIIGAGPDALPVVKLARVLDWEVTVVDHREAYADPRRFTDADRALTTTPESLPGQVKMETVDAVVLMTHNIGYDERFLKVLAPTAVGYIGMLGPAARRERLLTGLGASAESLRKRVFGPVGLDIGAELPEEIGISIIAEVVAWFRGEGRYAARAHRKQAKGNSAQSDPVHGVPVAD